MDDPRHTDDHREAEPFTASSVDLDDADLMETLRARSEAVRATDERDGTNAILDAMFDVPRGFAD